MVLIPWNERYQRTIFFGSLQCRCVEVRYLDSAILVSVWEYFEQPIALRNTRTLEVKFLLIIELLEESYEVSGTILVNRNLDWDDVTACPEP